MDASLVFWVSYLGFGAICTLLELVRPAHKVKYRKAIVLDLIAFAAVQLVVVEVAKIPLAPVADYLLHQPLLTGWWLPLRVLAFYLVADFGSYWMHRLMHTRHVWRVHRWHHSPTQLYWLGGVRSTIPQQLLFNVPYVVAVPLLAGAPTWLILAMVAEEVIRNHWMHMNVAWRSSWLERVLVTPRYHHIHHSADAQLHDGNYGALFTIWDRVFGTYLDPDVIKPKKFGTGEPHRDPVWLMIGV